jgi:hypothetical protein
MSIRLHSTVDVADDMMGCSERWLIEQLRARRFPGRKIGRHWRMTDQDVLDAIDICSNNTRSTDGTSSVGTVGLTPTSRKRHLRPITAGGTDVA